MVTFLLKTHKSQFFSHISFIDNNVTAYIMLNQNICCYCQPLFFCHFSNNCLIPREVTYLSANEIIDNRSKLLIKIIVENDNNRFFIARKYPVTRASDIHRASLLTQVLSCICVIFMYYFLYVLFSLFLLTKRRPRTDDILAEEGGQQQNDGAKLHPDVEM